MGSSFKADSCVSRDITWSFFSFSEITGRRESLFVSQIALNDNNRSLYLVFLSLEMFCGVVDLKDPFYLA